MEQVNQLSETQLIETLLLIIKKQQEEIARLMARVAELDRQLGEGAGHCG
jgi:hypothetical protein